MEKVKLKLKHLKCSRQDCPARTTGESIRPRDTIEWENIRFGDLKNKLPEPLKVVGISVREHGMGEEVILQDNRGGIHFHQVLDLEDFAYGSDARFQAQHKIYVMRPKASSSGFAYIDREDAERACEKANSDFGKPVTNNWMDGATFECYNGCDIEFEVVEEFC